MMELGDRSGDWTEDFEYENGQYFNQCCVCSQVFVGHKRRATCKACVRGDRDE